MFIGKPWSFEFPGRLTAVFENFYVRRNFFSLQHVPWKIYQPGVKK
jgi:hypothetical protein